MLTSIKKLSILFSCFFVFNAYSAAPTPASSNDSSEVAPEVIKGWNFRVLVDNKEKYSASIKGASGSFQKDGVQNYVSSVKLSAQSPGGPLCSNSRLTLGQSCECSDGICTLVTTKQMPVGIDLKIDQVDENSINVSLLVKTANEFGPGIAYIKETLDIKNKKELSLNRHDLTLILKKL